MCNERSKVTEEVADRLQGKKVIKRAEVSHSASEAAETVNRELELRIESPDRFSELRDSIEEAVLKYLASEDDLSVI